MNGKIDLDVISSKEDKIPVLDLMLDIDSNNVSEDIANERSIKFVNKNNKFNNNIVIYINKEQDYITSIDNKKIDQFINEIGLFKVEENKEPKVEEKINKTNKDGFINFTLLLSSITFLSILSIMLGLLIIGK